MSIQRYRPSNEYSTPFSSARPVLVEDDDGKAVLHTDHLAAIEAAKMDAELVDFLEFSMKKLETMVDALGAEFTDVHGTSTIDFVRKVLAELRTYKCSVILSEQTKDNGTSP